MGVRTPVPSSGSAHDIQPIKCIAHTSFSISRPLIENSVDPDQLPQQYSSQMRGAVVQCPA